MNLVGQNIHGFRIQGICLFVDNLQIILVPVQFFPGQPNKYSLIRGLATRLPDHADKLHPPTSAFVLEAGDFLPPSS